MTRQQRLRQQKGLERADMNVDKLENKIAKSKVKSKVIKERSVCCFCVRLKRRQR